MDGLSGSGCASRTLPERRFDLGSERAAEDAGGGLRRWMLYGENVQVIRYEFPPGASLRTHRHAQEQALVVTRGRILFVVQDREYVLERGDSIVIPPNVDHSSRVLPGETAESLVVLAPPRL